MQDGHPEVDIRQLVHDHHADVYRYAHRLCGQPADAEDLAQQAFLTAQRHLGQLRDPLKARPWLLAITRNCFLKDYRKRQPQAATALDFELDQVPHPAADDPIDAEALQAALAELAEEFRVVVLMFYFEFLSYREIADQLDVPVGTVMSRLARAKVHLRRLLTRDGETNNAAHHVSIPVVPAGNKRSLEDSNV
jgi:RNA polymerase sigma-70 factor, ECF subfamily